ncbi:MAG TPA: aminopeptidase [Gaiellaceae bacterium]|nr:aminopeptidase [Gaiellaceae bacterium]
MTEEQLEAYAEIAVRVGANVQSGQEVFVHSLVEHAPVTRALARQAYRAGASYVNVVYSDMRGFIQRAMIEVGPDEALTYSPEWLKAFVGSMSGQALLATTGEPDPEAAAALDGERLGRSVMLEVAEIRHRQHRENSVNWCGIGAPTEGWARQIYGEPDVERLWNDIAVCMRLDEPDPVQAWRDHLARLHARGAVLTELRPDALRYRGPGTDLTVGLFPSARWMSAGFETAGGVDYVANMPTEEIFTTPDPRRADGTIRSSLPLSLGGQVIVGLELTVRDGRIVGVDAEQGAEIVRSQLETVENADRFGELALVTGDSRVGRTGTTFFNTLFDENATCHIAYGAGLPYPFEGEPDPAINVSNIHTDFMVGGPELEVDALLADGSAVPLIRDETWQLA